MTYLGIRKCRGFRLKSYAITYDDANLRVDDFEAVFRVAERDLPSSAIGLERPGVGFVIMHHGRTGNYLILGWWDREKELPLRVYVNGSSGWRPAVGGESICVWDLRVFWAEREAYVATLLGGSGVEEYLDATVSGFA